MVGLILKIVIWVSLCVWLVVRVKLHPEKDRSMRRIMEEQRGAEYEAGMQKFLIVNYLIGGLALVVTPLLGFILGMDELPLGLIAGCVVCLVMVITHWRFTGEFSKFVMVFFAVWFVFTIVFFIIDVKLKKPATVEVSDDYITAKGSAYSASIPVADIATTTILSDWPAISHGTDHLSTNKVNIGHFRLKSGESCMLFLCVDGGPVLEVRTNDGQLYYLNSATEEETLEMIDKVKAVTTVKESVVSSHCEEPRNPDKEPTP